MNKIYLTLIIILILGIFLRFYNLGSFPISLHRDEAFLGYNAYSILKTGKDISGSLLPLHTESFLYSPLGYSYLSIPFIYMFGLNEFSVRAASAFFGSLTVLIIYFLVRELFSSRNIHLGGVASQHPRGGRMDSSGAKPVNLFALFSALFFAINPWHINLSRTATENIIVTFFIVAGILFYLISLSKGWKHLIISFILFSTTLFIYQAPRAFLPIFIPIMILVFNSKKELLRNKFMLLVLYLIFIIAPLVFVLLSPQLSLRIRTLSIFHDKLTQLIINEQIANDGSGGLPYIVTRAFHNKVIGYGNLFLENYFKHFSFDFLFLDKGYPDRYRIPGMGLLYVFELPLIVLGAIYLFVRYRKIGIFIVFWILVAPIGSALTFDDVPNLQRTIFAIPAYSILSGFGLVVFLKLIKSFNIRIFRLSIIASVFIIIFSVFYYLVQYYFQARVYRSWYRQDGYKELVKQVNRLLPNYKKAIITNRESAPTIFFLFYSKYNPQSFQKTAYLSKLRDFDRISFDKYNFTQDECPLRTTIQDNVIISTAQEQILYVNSGLCKDTKSISKVLSEIKRIDNSLVFYVAE